MREEQARPPINLPLPDPSEIVGAGLAELLAHVLGAGWTASVLAPALTAVARTVWEADRRQWQQAAQAVHVAEMELGGADVVRDQALASPARTELFRRVVQAAGRSPIEEKITALGRVLAAGLADDAQVDEALLLAGALSAIEVPHAQVLQVIAGPWVESGKDPTTSRGAQQGTVSARVPGHRTLLPSLLQTLRGLGLVEDVGYPARQEPAGAGRAGVKYTRPDPRWRPTELGVQCCALLQDAGLRVADDHVELVDPSDEE